MRYYQGKSTLQNSLIVLLSAIIGWYCHFLYESKYEWDMLLDNLTAKLLTTSHAVKNSPGTFTTHVKNSPATEIKHFDELLDEGDSFQLVQYLEEVKKRDESAWSELRTKFTRQLSFWNAHNKQQLTLEFGQSFLTIFYNDTDVIQLVAEGYLQLNRIDDAIRTYYTAKLYLENHDELQLVTKQIHLLVAQHHATLETQHRWQELLEFYQYLLDTEPEYPPYSLGQAKIYIAQKNFRAAQQILAQLSDDPNTNEEVEKLNASVNRALSGQIQVPIEKKKAGYLVPATMEKDHNLTLLLDTGANISALKKSVFLQLSKDIKPHYKGTQTISTANGSIQAPIYLFNQIALNNYIFKNIEFIILENLSAADGLLGMNILDQTQFEIDPNGNFLLLQPR